MYIWRELKGIPSESKGNLSNFKKYLKGFCVSLWENNVNCIRLKEVPTNLNNFERKIKRHQRKILVNSMNT